MTLTLLHGDYKEHECILPHDVVNGKTLLVDYASTGVGLGMSDVATYSSCRLPEDLANGGEEAWSSTIGSHCKIY
jgi:hypothetical protein